MPIPKIARVRSMDAPPGPHHPGPLLPASPPSCREKREWSAKNRVKPLQTSPSSPGRGCGRPGEEGRGDEGPQRRTPVAVRRTFGVRIAGYLALLLLASGCTVLMMDKRRVYQYEPAFAVSDP